MLFIVGDGFGGRRSAVTSPLERYDIRTIMASVGPGLEGYDGFYCPVGTSEERERGGERGREGGWAKMDLIILATFQ